MLRRVLFTVSLAALGFAGAASATLVSARSVPREQSPPTGASAVTTPPAATTAAATAKATTPAATTTTPPAVSTTATTVASTLGVSAAPSTLVITGHGWGHGVGMAQWGAYGYAQHGWTYDRILAHYYRGTTLEQRPSPTVRVLLLEGAKRVVACVGVAVVGDRCARREG